MYLKIEFIFIARSCDPTSVLHRLGDLADALLCRSFCYLASNQGPRRIRRWKTFPQQNHWFRTISSCIWMFGVLKNPNNFGFLQVWTSPYVEWYQMMFERLKWPKLMVVEHPQTGQDQGVLDQPIKGIINLFFFLKILQHGSWYFDYPFCSKHLSRS